MVVPGDTPRARPRGNGRAARARARSSGSCRAGGTKRRSSCLAGRRGSLGGGAGGVWTRGRL